MAPAICQTDDNEEAGRGADADACFGCYGEAGSWAWG